MPWIDDERKLSEPDFGFHLHLIQPLGFTWDDKRLRRAGLDYREFADIKQHHDYYAFLESEGLNPDNAQ